MSTLSVIIITKNEAAVIEDCLRSVAFADETIVLDSGSTDGTCELALSMGAQVHKTLDWPGFGPQKNRALALANSDWVLSLDADERVSSSLQQQIVAVLDKADAQQDAYLIGRTSTFCGEFMRHSGWAPDYVCRLFKRGTATFSDDQVHESLKTTPRVGTLSAKLVHLSFANIEEVLFKMNSYSTARASDLVNKRKTGGLSKAIGHGVWTFIRTYFLRLGLMDGRRGFVLAVSNANGTFYRYLKMCPDFNHTRGLAPEQSTTH